MLVLKFGGTSVADADAIRRAAAIVGAQRGPRVVVVSALAGVTDGLLAVADLAYADEARALSVLDALVARHHEVARTIEQPARRQAAAAAIDRQARGARAAIAGLRDARRPSPAAATDRLVATGELWSSRLAAAIFEDAGLASRWLDARDVVRTDARHQAATPDPVATARAVDRLLRPAVAADRVIVTGGFIGSGPDGSTTTLGRGGSDYSAALLGACLSAREIQIWTDVDGVLTADPRVIAHARLVERLSYAEAHDLATFGAKVLHPGTIHPAAARNIPVRVLNSRRPDGAGTVIGPDAESGLESRLTAVACRRGLTLVEVTSRETRGREPFAARVFDELARNGTPVVLADVCGTRLSVAVDEDTNLDAFCSRVSAFADVRRREGLAAICAVGRGWSAGPQLIREALAVIGDTPVHMVARPSGSSPLAFVVDEAHAQPAMTRLHDGFMLDAELAPSTWAVGQ